MARAAATTSRTGRSKAPASKVLRPRWRRWLAALLIFLSTLCVLALIIAGYGGHLSPLKYGGAVGILPLCFPFVALACVFILIADCFFSRTAAIILSCGMILTAGPLLDICPLHPGTRKAPAGSETFSLLTYNTFQFIPREGLMNNQNPTLAYIIEANADIVCLQEANFMGANERTGITKEQVDSLSALYPNIIHSSNGIVVLSKFDIEAIHLNANEEAFAGGEIGAYRVTLPSGRLLGLFNVHLNSYGLSEDDKELYRDLTGLRREPISDIREQLIDKLSAAAVGRARQAQQLMRWVRLYGGPDAIICGDFNDVPDCYAIHTLEDAGFCDVYPQVGFGPMFTYNAGRFLFCIDHILVRGDLCPLSLRKGHLRSSDHYPLEVEFALAGVGDN